MSYWTGWWALWMLPKWRWRCGYWAFDVALHIWRFPLKQGGVMREDEFLDGGADELTAPNLYCPHCDKCLHSADARKSHIQSKHSHNFVLEREIDRICNPVIPKG